MSHVQLPKLADKKAQFNHFPTLFQNFIFRNWESVPTEKMAEILGVPEGYELICYLPVGIPAEEIKSPEKKPFEERAWFNGFGKTE